MENEKDFLKYLNGDIDQSIDPLKDFADQAKTGKIPEGRKTKDDIWSGIENHIEKSEHQEETLKKGSGVSLYLGLAATLLLVLVSIFVLRGPSSDPIKKLSTGKYTLPDESLVTLAQESTIKYSEKWSERKLTLEGEAFFQVEEGEDFSVETSWGLVQVLGTSFNVFSRPEKFEVSCKTGKVRVVTVNQSFILNPGESVIVDQGTPKLKKVKPARIGSWEKGEFYYDARPVSEVFMELGRQYELEVELDGVEGRLFTGYFYKGDINLSLAMICEPLNLSFVVLGGKKVIVSPK